jgi:hypothetical protein
MIRTPRKRSTRYALVATTLLAGIAIGSSGFADDGEGGNAVTPPPGEVILGSGAEVSTQTFSTSGGTFDPTILTKFIPGRSFVANQGDGIEADKVDYGGGDTCVQAETNGGGLIAVLYAPVELPDGARIKRVTFFGADSYAPSDIIVTLSRSNVSLPLLLGGSPSQASATVTTFTTTGSGGNQVVSSTDNLAEMTGSFNSSPLILSSNHRFHSVRVQITNAAAANHTLCGVEVQYQVSATTEVSYHPISPVRAVDTRIAAYGASAGIFAPGTNRVISIADGHDLATGAVTLANAVPAGATAITYNLTAADPVGGSNFLAIAAGDATTFAASALNYNGTSIANGGTAPIASDRTVKIFNGAPPASTHVIIDITGYYTASVYPNTGN